MSTPAISVLLPAFNAAATLPATLDSLLAQQDCDYEVVAVDDGSTDDTPRILAGYAARDAHVRVLTLPANQGVVRAAQHGLDACRAPVVARMDADDLAHPQRLARQLALLRNDPALGVVSCLVEPAPGDPTTDGFRVYLDWLNGLVSPDDIARDIYIESPIANPTAMFWRAQALALGGYRDMGWPEDYDLYLRYHHAGYPMAKVPLPLLQWRDHPDRLTRSDSRYSIENFLRAKAHFLLRGPLRQRDALLIWGASQIGRRLAKHLQRGGAPLTAFFTVDQRKIGGTLRRTPIYHVDELPAHWRKARNPLVLVAVSSRRVRPDIRQQLAGWGLQEQRDFWLVA